MLKHGRYLVSLALPAIAGMASTTVMNNVDVAMVGRLGAEAIAAVGLSGVVMYNFSALVSIGLGSAVNYLVAQSYGAGEQVAAYRRGLAGLVLALGVGIPLAVGSWFLAGSFLSWLGASPEVRQTGLFFLRFRLCSLPFIMLIAALGGFLRGRGDTTTPALIMLLSNVLNVVLNYLFIFGPGPFPSLGVPGSGLATLVAEGAGAILFLQIFLRLWRKEGRFKGAWGAEVGLVARETIKIGLQEMGMSLSMLAFTVLVARFGNVALAANEIALNFLAFGFLPAYGFGIAATTAVGQRLGEGKRREAREIGKEVTLLGAMFMAMMGVVFFVLAPFIVSLYTPRGEVAQAAVGLIRLASFFQVADGTQIVMGGTLRGVGDNTFLVWATLGAGWFLFIPLAYLLAVVMGWGLMGAWLGLYTYLTVLAALVVWRFLHLPWEELAPL